MPATAAERGLEDPFDPKQAIPASASLLRQLANDLGNLGLAAAAYNSGRSRVSEWLAERGSLPSETQRYVAAITGRDAADWKTSGTAIEEQSDAGCLDTVAQLGRPQPQVRARAFSTWGTEIGAKHVRRVSGSGLRVFGNGHVRRVGSGAPMATSATSLRPSPGSSKAGLHGRPIAEWLRGRLHAYSWGAKRTAVPRLLGKLEAMSG
jgi:hypothetical protein